MQNTILVPLDGSQSAEQALPYALMLARTLNARLSLVLVWTPNPQDADPRRPARYLDDVVARIGTQHPHGIDRELLRAPANPLDYPPPVSNSIADVLAGYASDIEAAHVVMTTHGHGGIRRAWLGSVADSLIRLATVPVLLLRPGQEASSPAFRPDHGIRHVLIPLDGSEASETAIGHGLALGSPYGAHHTLLRVVTPLYWYDAPQVYDQQHRHPSPLSYNVVVDSLETVADGLRELGHRVSIRVLEDTSPAGAILDFAAANSVDLIALATRGAGPLRRLILGSVSDKVIRGSTVPVLVCNARHAELHGAAWLHAAAGTSLE